MFKNSNNKEYRIKSTYTDNMIVVTEKGYLVSTENQNLANNIFNIIPSENGTINIKIKDGNYVRLDSDYLLIADVNLHHATKFRLYKTSSNEYVLKGPNDYYVEVNDNYILATTSEIPASSTILKFKESEIIKERKYTGYTTFNAVQNDGILTVTFDYPPINVLGIPMLDDLNKLASELEDDISVKVVVFQSSNPDFFIAHADITFLKDMSTEPVFRENVQTSYLQNVLERISKVPQATIAKIEGYARGGGHEFCLACDMRFAARDKAIFMQMEVGMGILPCGGGSARMARQCGLGKALEIILSARDFGADEAEKFGTVNKALNSYEIDEYVFELANRISKFPSGSIEACKRAVHASTDLPIEEALKEEAYQLYQATSSTPAIKRFTYAYDTDFQNNINNQRNFESLLINLQDIK